MEYKIGQIFEIDGIWYQFVKDDANGCKNCVFYYYSKIKCAIPDEDIRCSKWHREDGNNGHFVRLLPLGKVYEQGGDKWWQYKCVEKPNTEDKRVYIANADSEVGLIVSIKLSSSNMERKIGEVFEYNGEWYQCVEGYHCYDCDFLHENGICIIYANYPESEMGNCNGDYRTDNQNVVFKKLEKVGEPFERNGYMYQEYKTHTYPLLMSGGAKIPTDNGFAAIIKQNKECMEEVNNPNLSNSENTGKNLKPFDLQAAKSGKPVCTRDGRKARIICFDSNGGRPIVALVTECDNEEEIPYKYHCDGSYNCQSIPSDNDLMMLPEKKEGWVNVYKRENEYICENECNVSTGIAVYKSKSEAKRNIDKNKIYINTIKISWEE